MDNLPHIPEYFRGKNIFITGGTGFLGKILIEKLLYSCPDLGNIYLMMRKKKDVMPMDRILELYKLPCFDRIRTERPGLYECKVKFIAGDVEEIGLGMSEEDKALIVATTNVIFHSAASVRFNDHLAKAVKMNLRGTKELIELAHQMSNLESFVHISTAFSNTYKEVINENLYTPLGDWRDVLQICDSFDKHALQVLTSKFIGDIPNTYVFTKHLTEHMIYEEKGKLPIVIYRPSIVIPSIDEPMPGWVDNYNGPGGILIGGSSGIIRALFISDKTVLDFIPADITIKGSIVAAWNRGIKELQVTDDIPIYNACNSGTNQLSMLGMLQVGQSLIPHYPLSKMLWTPHIIFCSNATVYYIMVCILHLIPAVFIDILLRILSIKPFLFKLQRRIFVANKALEPYMIKEWKFSNKNFQELTTTVLEKDHNSFNFDFHDLDLSKYCLNFLLGMKRYLLNEKDEDLPKYRIYYRRIAVMDKILKIAFYGYLIWFIFSKLWCLVV